MKRMLLIGAALAAGSCNATTNQHVSFAHLAFDVPGDWSHYETDHRGVSTEVWSPSGNDEKESLTVIRTVLRDGHQDLRALKFRDERNTAALVVKVVGRVSEGRVVTWGGRRRGAGLNQALAQARFGTYLDAIAKANIRQAISEGRLPNTFVTSPTVSISRGYQRLRISAPDVWDTATARARDFMSTSQMQWPSPRTNMSAPHVRRRTLLRGPWVAPVEE